MGSPGPATISLTAVGSAYGVRRSLGYLIGLIVGTAIVLVAVATGITATLLAVPALRSVLIVISAAYILGLAYHIATAPRLGDQTATTAAPSLVGGTLLGVANPKAWIAIAAVFASARLADSATTVDFPPGGGHRGYAAVVDGSGLMVACCCSHSTGDR
jgi:threonine/homoserine/homoserine lactone efflux protein